MSGDLQATFGRNVRAWRHKKGWSQDQLAEHIGISRSYLSLVERGTRSIGLRMVEKITAGIGVPPIDMLSE